MAGKSSIQKLGIDDKVLKKYFNEGKTIDEILEELRREGYEISRSALGRFIQKYQLIAKRLKLEGLPVNDKTLLEQSQYLSMIANGVVIETIERALTDENLSPQEKAELALRLRNAISRAESSEAQIVKAKYQVQEILNEIAKNIVEKLKATIDEEYLEIVLTAVKNAFEEAGV